jgi:hypothetical protein
MIYVTFNIMDSPLPLTTNPHPPDPLYAVLVRLKIQFPMGFRKMETKMHLLHEVALLLRQVRTLLLLWKDDRPREP